MAMVMPRPAPPIEAAPVRQAPIEAAPARPAPVEAVRPVEAALPVEAPAPAAPVEAAPAQTAPPPAAPVEAFPAARAPAPRAPIEISPPSAARGKARGQRLKQKLAFRAAPGKNAALASIGLMNAKAMEAYQRSDFEAARRLLRAALTACSSAGFDNHKVKAVTHTNLGVVLVGGFKQAEMGMDQFRKALQIDPVVPLSKKLAKPEVAAAFREAVAATVPRA
jgi:hypothetical protein